MEMWTTIEREGEEIEIEVTFSAEIIDDSFDYEWCGFSGTQHGCHAEPDIEYIKDVDGNNVELEDLPEADQERILEECADFALHYKD